MNRLFGWIALTTLVCSAWGGGVTAPPFVKPETGPPKDKFNCRINAESVLNWLVAVWDSADGIVVGHGSMLTYITFITTCRQYKKAASGYLAHAQFIWNLSQPFDACTQSKEVETIFKHPKCTDNMPDWSLYDFAVFRMKNAFDITGKSYSTVGLYNNEDELLNGVTYLNMIFNETANTTGCFLPSFRSQTEKIPIFSFNAGVLIIPFKTKCKKLLCEKEPADPSYTATCEKQFEGQDLDTILCAKNQSGDGIPLGKGNSYWLGGAPLFCNRSVLGMVSQPKMRKGYSTEPTDFHYIVTFFRIWPWIVTHISKNSVPWVKGVYIDSKMRFIVHERDEVSTDKPPKGCTYAVMPTPLIIGTLLYLLATSW